MISKKNILITCVNYNSNRKLDEYLLSLSLALRECDNSPSLTVIIGDNSDNVDFIVPNELGFDTVLINNGGNLGYLGGIDKALDLSKVSLSDFDYFIISNVDLTVSISFFYNLIGVKVDSDVGWIAPSIISEKEENDRNPSTVNRPSIFMLKIMLLLYKYPFLLGLYVKNIYRLRRKKKVSLCIDRDIYAGHGSFMIFTKAFINVGITTKYPCFLYCEEFFLAEQIRRAKLKVRYMQLITIHDFDHYSTGMLAKNVLNSYHIDSLRYIIRKIF